MTNGPRICDDGATPLIAGGETGGVFLPLFYIPGQGLQIVLYLIGLLWCFMGVGIISDIFMCAIEKITSAKKRVRFEVDGKEQFRTVKVWNDTVANLTLMALGSSAPEILLSLIELCLTEKMHSGALGPSTIVGSAAFNLLIITAVCISAIPDGEERKIKDTTVFGITAFFSVFAYLWLIIILLLITPDVVDIWEGVVTFLMFPLLVALAYLADIGYFHSLMGMTLEKKLVFAPHDTSKEDYEAMMKVIKAKYPKVPQESDKIQALLHYEFPANQSRAARRIEAVRNMTAQTGTKRDDHFILGQEIASEFSPDERHKQRTQSKGSARVHPVSTKDGEEETHRPKTNFEFASPNYACSEAQKKVTIQVKRTGNIEDNATVKCRTLDGTAKANEDYQQTDKKLDFPANTDTMPIEIAIFEDKKYETTEDFFVELYQPSANAILGMCKTTTVVVLDSDQPGMIKFETDTVAFPEPTESIIHPIRIKRVKGATGSLTCKFKTEDATAVASKDYVGIEEDAENVDANTLTFEQGQLEKTIPVELLPVATVDKRKESFRLVLYNLQSSTSADVEFEGDVSGEPKDGDGYTCTLTITIETDEDGELKYKGAIGAAATREWVNWDNVAIGRDNWSAQFAEALWPAAEEGEEPGVMDWVFHVPSLPWKLLFAIVPPVDFCGGWLCFFCALGMIGLCTAIIGDMANLLGCALEIKGAICAITFVALGTSLPDTFASKTAAMQDPTADNSVGNVTGSNSVNVFLGLGMSWTIGAIYWATKGADPTAADDPYFLRALQMNWPPNVVIDHPDGAFVVTAGNLGLSVAVFCICALLCLMILGLRRKFVGAELGGPKNIAYASSVACASLWFIYIGASVIIEETGSKD